ncbi:FZR1 [Bugula neritina]|uniref:Fizzy-related protein homolog n=1 Tax=Bugula neritina TaxID=10212 RepID=A0A7J7KJX5_BUGNE|nr:FZR1 [Bugula neritina]
MDPVYEKRLAGSPLSSPVKPQNSSPITSPTKLSYGDRFIPTRSGARWHINFDSPNVEKEAAIRCSPQTQSRKSKEVPSVEGNLDSIAYQCLLKNELLGAGIVDLKHSSNLLSDGVADPSGSAANAVGSVSSINNASSSHSSPTNGSCGGMRRRVLYPKENTSLFQYRVHGKNIKDDTSPYSLSPVGENSQKLLRSPRKAQRKIPRVPFKVLDAPELQDDFYLNLVDWSAQNVLSVGLGSCVYLWSANNSQVVRLCDLSVESDTVTSVSWADRGNYVAVGTNKGYVQIWDVAATKRVSHFSGHTARVGALAWNADLLSSGSRDRNILQRDIRSSEGVKKLTGHRQEVCGLKWSPDHQHLASGGNDNKLLVWNASSSNTPLQTYSDHVAAVKAIAWSPHQHGLLASGGGTADRCIRFWNTLTGQPLQSVDTGSQVCNLAWSKHSNELVSTHGYSQNQILVWKYPSLLQMAKLTGHSFRVLYLAMSPDGEAIVTGAGDETLRFWNVFSKTHSNRDSKSVLNLFNRIR